ncbi:MAG: Uma2 family endonuclease [Spirochaetota bacterium]
MKRMADPVRKADRHYTYRELATWPDDERWELIDGVAWNMCAAPSPSHQRVLGDLYEGFRKATRGTGCEALLAPLDVFLFADDETDTDDADTVVQPDLIVICDDSRVTRRGYTGAPAIVIEILSPYTLTKDITVKRDLYERSGVAEYWIVDPGNQSVMIYNAGDDGGFPEEPRIVSEPDPARSRVLPTAVVTLPFRL